MVGRVAPPGGWLQAVDELDAGLTAVLPRNIFDLIEMLSGDGLGDRPNASIGVIADFMTLVGHGEVGHIITSLIIGGWCSLSVFIIHPPSLFVNRFLLIS